MSSLNLDQLAARCAQKIVAEGKDKIETPATKALGVLQEQGVYACILYLLANEKKDDSMNKCIRIHLTELLNELPGIAKADNSPGRDSKSSDVLKYYSDTVCANLDTLLLVKDLYEQTLIYVRYGAKACKAENEPSAETN